MEFKVATFYKFVTLTNERLAELRADLVNEANARGVLGLILLAPEGCNATIAARPEHLDQYCRFLLSIPDFFGMQFKYSSAEKSPFRRLSVQRRDEIVTLKKDCPLPQDRSRHLSPAEWNEVLNSGEDIVLLDVRNSYETGLGIFRGATDPKIKRFSDFPEYVERSGIPKDKKVLMYCTGGIRCEKALLEMNAQGYSNVFQLDGGILKYLEEFPEGAFEGECFVFDHRVALDARLSPSKRYKLCRHCGDPGTEQISCSRCGAPAVICAACKEHAERNSCSKNCAHHLILLRQRIAC